MAETESPPPMTEMADDAGHGFGAGTETGVLEHAHRSIPENRRGVGDKLAEGRGRGRSDVESLETVGNVFTPFEHRVVTTVTEGGAHAKSPRVRGDDDLAAGHQLGTDSEVRGVKERRANGASLGRLEGVGHSTTDDDLVGLFAQDLDDA